MADEFDPFEEIEGGNHWCDLAANTVDEYLSEDRTRLMIAPYLGRFYLSRSDMAGEIDYDNLAKAKKEGMRIHLKSFDDQKKNILKSLNVVAGVWDIELGDDTVRLDSLIDPDKSLVRTSASKQWVLYDGKLEIGKYNEPRFVVVRPPEIAASLKP